MSAVSASRRPGRSTRSDPAVSKHHLRAASHGIYRFVVAGARPLRQDSELHTEVRLPNRLNRRPGAVHLDMGYALPTEEVKQEFPRWPGDACAGLSSSRPNRFRGSRPLKFQPNAAKAPRKEPRREPDVSPERLVHRGVIRPRVTTVGSAYVLVVDEQFIQGRESAHPTDTEEARRRPQTDRVHEPGEIP